MGILGIGVKKTPKEKLHGEERFQRQLEKRIRERIKIVIAADNWVAVAVCDRYRPSSPSESHIRFITGVWARSFFPHMPEDHILHQRLGPVELKKSIENATSELTEIEIQTLVREGFRCVVAGVWVKGADVGEIWRKKCANKEAAKEEARRIKELLGW